MNWNKVNLRMKPKNRKLPELGEPILWATNKESTNESVYFKFVGWLVEEDNELFIKTINKRYKLTSDYWWCEMSNPNQKEEEFCEIENEWGRKIKAKLISSPNSPYLEYEYKETIRKYNPNYGDNRVCVCGHTYYRHFDSWEGMMACGCKYCCCHNFVEGTNREDKEVD